jgi:hypothetical protein
MFACKTGTTEKYLSFEKEASSPGSILVFPYIGFSMDFSNGSFAVCEESIL